MRKAEIEKSLSMYISRRLFAYSQVLNHMPSKLFGVSSKTWQNYRGQRLIPFSQIGRKIYVNRADLDAFLSNYFRGNRLCFTA